MGLPMLISTDEGRVVLNGKGMSVGSRVAGTASLFP